MSVVTVFDSIERDESHQLSGCVQRHVVVRLGKWVSPGYDSEYLEWLVWIYRRIGINRHSTQVSWVELPGGPTVVHLGPTL